MASRSGTKLLPVFLAVALSVSCHAAVFVWLGLDSWQMKPQPESPLTVRLFAGEQKPGIASTEPGPQAADSASPLPDESVKTVPLPAKQPKPPVSPKKSPASARALGPARKSQAGASQANQGSSKGNGSGGNGLATGQGDAPARQAGQNKAPVYPPLARKRNQEGLVKIRCQIDATGKVASCDVARSSGYRLLDEAALKAVGKWNFRPAIRNGKAEPASVIVPVEFKLQ